IISREVLRNRATKGKADNTVGVNAELFDGFLHVTCQIRNGSRTLNNRRLAVAAMVDGDDAEDIGKRIELRQPHINCGANRPDEHQGALWSLRLAWSVFNKVQLFHVFLAFLFYDCCHALTATDAHGGKTQLAALALETVCQSHQHAGAGRANWVTQGDTRTPSVEAGIIPRQVPFLQHSECLRCESLVELDGIQVIQADAGALQCLL